MTFQALWKDLVSQCREEMSKMEITEFEEVLKHLDISGNADSGKLTAS
jgi:hypothetical protein